MHSLAQIFPVIIRSYMTNQHPFLNVVSCTRPLPPQRWFTSTREGGPDPDLPPTAGDASRGSGLVCTRDYSKINADCNVSRAYMFTMRSTGILKGKWMIDDWLLAYYIYVRYTTMINTNSINIYDNITNTRCHRLGHTLTIAYNLDEYARDRITQVKRRVTNRSFSTCTAV